METVEDHQDSAVLAHVLPLQRQARSVMDAARQCPGTHGQDEVAKVVRALDEARAFARDLWVATPLDVKFTVAELRGGLPSWIPRP